MDIKWGDECLLKKCDRHFRRSLFLFFIISIFAFILFSGISFFTYKNSVQQSNRALFNLIAVIREKYPDVDDEKILDILNETSDTSFFRNYGIDLEDTAILSSLSYDKMKVQIFTFVVWITCFGSLFFLFYWYATKKKREIQAITKLIDDINHKIYTISLEEHQEDAYSLLKSELYKTTIMLKEQAENSELEKNALKTALSDISHQIKTPLTSILIMLDTITDYPNLSRDMELEFLEDIRSQIERIHFLTMSLLRLAQLDAGVIHFKKEKVDGRKLIDSVCANLEVLSSSKNVSIQVSGDNHFMGDFKFLEEALMNILKNSIEASDANDEILIQMEDNPVYSKFVISDTGRGISKEDLSHIFDRFYKTASSKSDSIGIGLSLSKKVIEGHNGRIFCDSEIGKGTTFTIKFIKE